MVKKTNTWRAAYHQLGPMTGDLPLQSYNLYTSKSKFFLKKVCKTPIIPQLPTENSWLFYYFFHSFHPFHYIRVFPPIFHPAVETHAQVNGVEKVENTDESGRGDPSTAASAHPSVTGMRMPH